MLPFRSSHLILALTLISGLSLTACGRHPQKSGLIRDAGIFSSADQHTVDGASASEATDPNEVKTATQVPEREMTRDEVEQYAKKMAAAQDESAKDSEEPTEAEKKEDAAKAKPPIFNPQKSLKDLLDENRPVAKQDNTRVKKPIIIPIDPHVGTVAKKPTVTVGENSANTNSTNTAPAPKPLEKPSPVIPSALPPWWLPSPPLEVPSVLLPQPKPSAAPAPAPSAKPDVIIIPAPKPSPKPDVIIVKPSTPAPTTKWPQSGPSTKPSDLPDPDASTTTDDDTGIDAEDEKASEEYSGPKTVVSRPASTPAFNLSETAAHLAGLKTADYLEVQYDEMRSRVRACNFFVITAMSIAKIADEKHLPMYTAGSFDTKYFIPKGWKRISVAEMKDAFTKGLSFDVVLQRDPPAGKSNGHIAIPIGLNADGEIMVAEGVLGRIANRIRVYRDSEISKNYKIFSRGSEDFSSFISN